MRFFQYGTRNYCTRFSLGGKISNIVPLANNPPVQRKNRLPRWINGRTFSGLKNRIGTRTVSPGAIPKSSSWRGMQQSKNAPSIRIGHINMIGGIFRVRATPSGSIVVSASVNIVTSAMMSGLLCISVLIPLAPNGSLSKRPSFIRFNRNPLLGRASAGGYGTPRFLNALFFRGGWISNILPSATGRPSQM